MKNSIALQNRAIMLSRAVEKTCHMAETASSTEERELWHESRASLGLAFQGVCQQIAAIEGMPTNLIHRYIWALIDDGAVSVNGG